MATTLQGIVLFATFEKEDVFQYTDPKTNVVRPLRSLKVLLAHGDGTVTRESISIGPDFNASALTPQKVFGFQTTAVVSKKTGRLSFTLVPNTPILPAPTFD
ncbi:MAG TPA: hypothetical protein PK264_01905 [Hyphomicrobiaceae bacterium]|nr:hypothetical protein [Hyphomicrobiaceae bacterium]